MYKAIITKHFKKQLKSYVKKFKGILNDVIKELIHFQKEQAVHLGSNVFKTRFITAQLKRGKSKSFRLIVYIIKEQNLISPLAIYQKNKQDSISKKQLTKHLKKINNELKNFY